MPYRVPMPPLPPDWLREDDPTVPEQIPGSGTPIIPPEADPFTGQPVATPLSASYKDQIEQMVSKLANRTGKFVTGGGEPKMASSVMGETGDRLANVVAGYLKMFAPDPTIVTPMAGTIVPKRGVKKLMPGAFTKQELAAQKAVDFSHPKLLAALRNDQRARGEYELAFKRMPGQRGHTEITRDMSSLLPNEPIRISLSPTKSDFTTPLHEAEHAFSYRRRGSGTIPRLDEFNKLTPEVKRKYLNLAEGDVAHAATYARADQAAYRLKLAPGPFSSITP